MGGEVVGRQRPGEAGGAEQHDVVVSPSTRHVAHAGTSRPSRRGCRAGTVRAAAPSHAQGRTGRGPTSKGNVDGEQQQRAVVAGAVAAGIGLSFGAGIAVGSDEPDTPGRPLAADRPGSGRVILANADVTITESCDDLLAHYVERGVERVTPWGWGYGDVYYATEGDAESSVGGAARDSAAAPVPQTTRAGGSDTGTNVQEEGVDEPDVVKTDGELLVRIKDDVLTAYSLTGEDPVLVDTIDLPVGRGRRDPARRRRRRRDRSRHRAGVEDVRLRRRGQRPHPRVRRRRRRPGGDGGHVELALRRRPRDRAPARLGRAARGDLGPAGPRLRRAGLLARRGVRAGAQPGDREGLDHRRLASDRRPPTVATPSSCWSAATSRCPTTRPGSAR